MNVVVWARVSSREQREGYSIDAQLRATREMAARNGWTILTEFSVAESAKRGAERKAFNDMFRWVKAIAKKERIHAILSHKLDRVCRNMRDAVRLQELEDLCGVRLAFVENQFGPGAAGALSFNVMAAVAQYYSDNLRSEVLKGMDEKVRQGWPTGHAPYGYLNVEDKAEPIVPHPEKSRALVRIFELYATGQYTLDSLSAQLKAEGLSYRPSQPRFNRTTLSYILNNRFYIGELARNGRAFPGRHKLLIERRTFEACQDLLNGRNRRTGNQEILFSGGLITCAICGSAITGERIQRKLAGGATKAHVYYRCGNNHQAADHPRVRWREDALEAAIVEQLDAIRIPSQEVADWLRAALAEAFADADFARTQLKKTLGKRRTELANMQERLLTGYLAGLLDEATFQAKGTELKGEAAEVERQLAEAEECDPRRGERALSVFDFSQNLAKLWNGSNFGSKREILEAVSLNRTLSHVSLYLTKRKPFDFLAEGLSLKDGRGDWI